MTYRIVFSANALDDEVHVDILAAYGHYDDK